MPPAAGWIAPPDGDEDGCYDYNLECLYTVLGRKNEVIEFQVLYVDVEASSGCQFDYLSVSIKLTFITKTRPCNIQGFFKLYKLKIFSRKNLIFLTFLFKTLIVGTC